MERIFIMQQPKEHSFDSEKFISWLGRFASVIAILMYVSYIAQIIMPLMTWATHVLQWRKQREARP